MRLSSRACRPAACRMPVASYSTSSEKNAAAPNSGECQPASSPTPVESAQTDAACAEGMPPMPVRRVKSTRRLPSAAKPNLKICAELSAMSASMNGGFHSIRFIKLLMLAFGRESGEAFELGRAQPDGIEGMQRLIHFMLCATAGTVQSHEGRERRFAHRAILARALSQAACRGRDIEHVVRNLKRQTHGPAVLPECVQRFVIGLACPGTEA